MPNHGFDGLYLDFMEDAANFTVLDGDFYGCGEVPQITHGVCLVEASWGVKPNLQSLL
jgi:lipopolysaccharide transport system ATP-binding protein